MFFCFIHIKAIYFKIFYFQINMLTEKKSELERKISLITEERNTLAFTLEETQDRVVMLEKQKREQDQLVRKILFMTTPKTLIC